MADGQQNAKNTPKNDPVQLKRIDPLELFLWTFRRNERDVVNLYNSLSDVMRLATGTNALNFGYWDGDSGEPGPAQDRLAEFFGDIARLGSADAVLDVGSGFSEPAVRWRQKFGPLDLSCVNINYGQLSDSRRGMPAPSGADCGIQLVNATATRLPFGDCSFDRVLAFESAQHFRPLGEFFSESGRILRRGGILALAIPVVTQESLPLLRLGILSLTWSSERYSAGFVESSLERDFRVVTKRRIGRLVYGPLADYYERNRDAIRRKISRQYPAYVENVLYRSMQKMRRVSRDGVIDYLVLACQKR